MTTTAPQALTPDVSTTGPSSASYRTTQMGVYPLPVMPAKAGIQAFLLDSRQSLSPQVLGGEHAGMTFWDNGHSILWNGTCIF